MHGIIIYTLPYLLLTADPARFYEGIVPIVPQFAEGCTNIYGTGSVSEDQLSGKVKDASVVTHELRLIKLINGGAQVTERVCVCCLRSTSGSVVLLFISSANISYSILYHCTILYMNCVGVLQLDSVFKSSICNICRSF